MIKIAVAGAGYVGLSVATLLSQNNEVYLVDVIKEKIDKVNNRISPIKDEYIEKYFAKKNLNLTATMDSSIYAAVDYVVIAVPTNYDETSNKFDTHFIENVIEIALSYNKDTKFVIKSTIPVGYCESIKKRYEGIHLMFAPEFLRESKALYDNLYPARIIVGCSEDMEEDAHIFASLLAEGAIKENIETLYMSTTEAEAVKLFANTYLAMRVNFFNELDTYAEYNNLSSENIIKGISLDPRIGNFYNNPSFGYGGYCLPKDTKQLLSNYNGIPQKMMTAIVESNDVRKKHIAQSILSKNTNTIGIYRLIMKSDSDNFRKAAIMDVIEILKSVNRNIIVYEPTVDSFDDYVIENDLNKFKETSDIIVANRYSEELNDVMDKVYTKDIFNNN